jgi:methylthioribose-1-phosphate isomerase
MNLAILCQYFSIPFYIAVPLSTVDIETTSGEDIEIEERDASEVKEYAGHPVAPVGVAAWSPAFDVTPHKLITGIITDAGLLRPPYTESIAKIMKG